jgi:non-ribosomal peptide synthetase component F
MRGSPQEFEPNRRIRRAERRLLTSAANPARCPVMRGPALGAVHRLLQAGIMSVSLHASAATAAAPSRPIALAPARVGCDRRPDGKFLLRSPTPLAPYDANLGRMFRSAVEAQAQRIVLAERGLDRRWRKLSYAQARRQVDAIAQALLDRGLSAERPVMVLSGNDIEHALLMLACYAAGLPIASISTCRRASPRCCRTLRPTKRWRARSSRGCG